MSAIFKHLEYIGVDIRLLWSRIYDVVIKSIISLEDTFISSMKKTNTARSNCFEVYGFDILIDSNLK